MNKLGLRFNAGVEYKGKIYASAVNINGLFRVDCAAHETIYVNCFSKEKACFAIHRRAFLYGNEAWFVPQNGKYIAVVNLDTLEITYYNPPFKSINRSAVSTVNAVYYSGDIIGNRYLYLIPANIDALLLIDLETKAFYPYYGVSTEKEYYLYGTYADGSVYLWPGTGSTVMQLNLKTGKKKRYSWKYPIETFAEGVCRRDRFWFAPFRGGFILMIDLKTKETVEIPLPESRGLTCLYEQTGVYGNKIFFMPFEGDNILELDVDTGAVKQRYLSPELLENGKNGFCKIFSRDNLIVSSYHKHVILLYDKAEEDFRAVDCSIDREDLIKEIKKRKDLTYRDILNKDIWEQEEYTGLEEYIRHSIVSGENRNNRFEDVGGNIFKTMI